MTFNQIVVFNKRNTKTGTRLADSILWIRFEELKEKVKEIKACPLLCI